MTLSQLHYTSAPPGPDGSGFRFTAVSPGLPPALLREAEQLIGYEPPREAPARPTEAELALFPCSFAFSELADGSRLLSRTVYTGADYSGRWGNFHTHAVHLPAGTRLPGDRLPVTSWDSPEWAAATPEGRVPEPLQAFTASPRLDRAGLTAFAAARGPWLAGFFADLETVSRDPDTAQIVLIEEDSADVARWIALACTVLPRELGHRLTFTTYTRRPHLARQRIVGTLPDAELGVALGSYDHRLRVHDCTRDAPAPGGAGLWAELCARVWLAGEPDLFRRAAALASDGTAPGPDGSALAPVGTAPGPVGTAPSPVGSALASDGEAFDPGPLALVALEAGIALPSEGRIAVARRLAAYPAAVQARQIDLLCEPGAQRTPAELAALTDLRDRLGGRLAPRELAPLTVLLLHEALRTPGSPVPEVRESTAAEELPPGLTAALGPDLRAALADFRTDPVRSVGFLRPAELLGVDATDLLPGLADALATALVGGSDPAYPPAVAAAVVRNPALRAALLTELDRLAADDPAAVRRMLARTGLAVSGPGAGPHLRICACTAPDGDRLAALGTLLHASGVRPTVEPPVLKTAIALVWDGRSPTVAEARQLLAEYPPELHRAADTWSGLVEAVLGTAADERDAPQLAHEVLSHFRPHLGQRERAALLLLDLARELAAGTPAPGWVEQALQLRRAAEPVEPGLLGLAFAVIAQRLVVDLPRDELAALARSGDPVLASAYADAAHHGRFAGRLRTEPALAAACFTAWTAHAGTDPVWDRTRTALLDEVLRPAVRSLDAAGTAEVESRLRARGWQTAEQFRQWNGPGALGRMVGRLRGRSRRDQRPEPLQGEVEYPRGGDRP